MSQPQRPQRQPIDPPHDPNHGVGGATATKPQVSLSPWDQLPPGWETVVSPTDGRIYYWDRRTGRTSWAHPLATLTPATPVAVGVGDPPTGSLRLSQHNVFEENKVPSPPPPNVDNNIAPLARTTGLEHNRVEAPPPQAVVTVDTKQPNHESLLPATTTANPTTPTQAPRRMRTGGGRRPINPFHGWGEFFSGGYQSAIPSSASYTSSNGSYSGYSASARNAAAHDYYETNQYDTPQNAAHRPSSHQCHAMVAFILFPPLGVCAFIHSFQVDNAWRQGRYGDAYNHSKQARSYATLACWIGFILWLYWLLFRYDGGHRIGKWLSHIFGN